MIRVPHHPELLLRIRHTPSQVGLAPQTRRENVRNAFQATTDAAGMRVLLIDDLCTTGATMRACSHALLDRGVRQVLGLTIARA